MTITKHTDAPFAPIPAALIDDQRLSLVAFKVACYILRHHPDWKISAKDVSTKTGFDRRNVTKAFDQLEECGYMTADRVLIGGRLCRVNISFSNKSSIQPQAAKTPENPGQDGCAPATGQKATDGDLAEIASTEDSTSTEGAKESPTEATAPTKPRSLAELAKEDSAAGAMAHAERLKSTFVLTPLATQAKPAGKVGVRINHGMLLDRFGNVIRKATQDDIENIGATA